MDANPLRIFSYEIYNYQIKPSSSIIYIQQLGRALSTGTKNRCIVFDIVDNLHRKSLFNLVPESKTRRKQKQPTKKERVERMLAECAHELSREEQELMRRFIDDNLEADDEVMFNAWWKKANELAEEDIYAVDHLATLRELIAKTVAEVKKERVKRATEEYFRIQLEKCKMPIPTTITELKKMKDLPPALQIFLDWQRVEEEDILNFIDPDGTGKIDVEKIKRGIKESMAY